MKVNRKTERKASILAVAVSVVIFLMGVWAGLQRRWVAMGATFFIVVLLFDAVVFSVLRLKIDSCFKRLEELASKQSDSAPQRTQK